MRSLVGHGIGRSMHEEPQIPNYGPPGKGVVLEEGMVLAIEPMVTAGRHLVRMGDDGWAIYSQDGSLAAHFEFTVAITDAGPADPDAVARVGAPRRGVARGCGGGAGLDVGSELTSDSDANSESTRRRRPNPPPQCCPPFDAGAASTRRIRRSPTISAPEQPEHRQPGGDRRLARRRTPRGGRSPRACSGRAAAAQPSGFVQRPCGWNAGPRGESISPGTQPARVSPQRPG